MTRKVLGLWFTCNSGCNYRVCNYTVITCNYTARFWITCNLDSETPPSALPPPPCRPGEWAGEPCMARPKLIRRINLIDMMKEHSSYLHWGWW